MADEPSDDNITGYGCAEMATMQKHSVILHSDQGSQFSSYEWQSILIHSNIIPSMSRRGNCYDNAVVESFFKPLKPGCIRKEIFVTREYAKSKIFYYIEIFYNPKRRYSYLGHISPNEFEVRYFLESTKNEVLLDYPIPKDTFFKSTSSSFLISYIPSKL